MSNKERRRLMALGKVKAAEMSLVQAAAVMDVCYRQAKRIWQRYQTQGDAGLVHRSRGRPGRRRKAVSEREKILRRYQERYPDFGPTLAAEHLSKEGLDVDHETLRRWLLAKGLWSVKRARQKHRQWRERKECFGEMVQMDGSHHDWFERRRERAVLMVMIDEATNRTVARFSEKETTRACYDVLEQWMRRYGTPSSLYVDRDSIYRCERTPTVAEQVAGQEPRTQFGRAMEELGVKLILANSPQAKGRVERRNAVFQDRLVKEMRLGGIDDLETANEFLERRFLPQMNRRFIKQARSAVDAHSKPPLNFRETLSWQEERVVQNDWTIVWGRRWFQIDREHEGLNLVGRKVMLRELRNGKIQAFYRGKKLRCPELPERPSKTKPAPRKVGRLKLTKPAAEHPWRCTGAATGREFWKREKARGALVKCAHQVAAGSVRPSLRSAITTPAAT